MPAGENLSLFVTSDPMRKSVVISSSFDSSDRIGRRLIMFLQSRIQQHRLSSQPRYLPLTNLRNLSPPRCQTAQPSSRRSSHRPANYDGPQPTMYVTLTKPARCRLTGTPARHMAARHTTLLNSSHLFRPHIPRKTKGGVCAIG